MKVNIFIILMLFLVFIISCESETDKPEMVITIGSVCGWCAGSDSLVITKSKMIYTLAAICDRSGYVKSKLTPDTVWDKIIAEYDQYSFSKININTCNVCADGCDTWIRVEHGTFRHEIRFGYQDSAILMPIKDFVEELNYEKTKYLSSD